MLELTSPASGSGMKLALLLRNLPPLTTVAFPYATFGADCFATDLLKTCYLVVDDCNPAIFYGKPGSHNRSSTTLYNPGLPPRQKEYSYSVDLGKYSNPIGAAFDVLGYSDVFPTRENQVVHTSVNGRVVPRVEDLYTYTGVSPSGYLHGFDEISYCDQMVGGGVPYYYAADLSSSTPGNTMLVGGYGYGPLAFSDSYRRLGQKMKLLHTYSSPYPYIGYQWFGPLGSGEKCFGDVNNVTGYGTAINSFSLTPSGYKMSNFIFSSSWMRVIDGRVTLSARLLQNPPQVEDWWGNNIYVVDITHHTWTSFYEYDASLGTGSQYPHWKPVSGWQGVPHTESWTLNCPNIALSKRYSNSISVPDLLKYGRSKTLEAIQSPMAQQLRDIRPSALNSYSDALSHYRLMSTNYIEVIAEAGELLSLAPDIAPLLKLFLSRDPKDLGYLVKRGSHWHQRILKKSSAGVRGISGFDTLLKIGDFFASTYLLKTFGWRPLGQNAQEITSKVNNIGAALRQLQSSKTLHGKFTFSDFSWLGFDGLQLTTRSKVRLGGVSNDFVIKTLQLDSLGIFPGASNIWDLIPYSWFIDYFTALSTRYDIVDSILLGHMLNTEYCTHSFNIEGDIPNGLLKNSNLSPSDTIPTFNVYFREFSRVVPSILYENVLDFSGPRYSPDKGVLASLLWILLRR